MIRFPFFLILLWGLCSFLVTSIYSNELLEKNRVEMKQRDHELLQLEKKRRNIAEDSSIFIKELMVVESRMHALDGDIYKQNEMIVETQRRIDQLQDGLKVCRKKIGLRIRDIYLQRDIKYVIQATSFQNFVVRLTYVLGVMNGDQKRIKEYGKGSTRLKEIKKALLFQLKEVLAKKKQAQKLLMVLQKKQLESQRNLASVTTRVVQIENENEQQQTNAFYLIKRSIEKAKSEEIQQNIQNEGPFYWPVDGGPITSTFGYRFDPILKESRLHRGLDIGGPLGAPIKAACAGKVLESRPSNGYGYIVVIYHGKGLSTLYAHMYGWTVRVKVGDFVHRGQVIAGVGSNGWSTGPHLHFEVIEGDQAKNPIGYFAKKG